MVRASFILVRKPVDDLDEYYQPMTVVLESATPKPLEILQRVVASPEITRKHMEEIMASKKRAEDTFLVFRLRRELGEAIPDKPELHEKAELTSRVLRERRARRESSTPALDLKSLVGTPQAAPSRPRVKTIKKVGHSVAYLLMRDSLTVLIRRFLESPLLNPLSLPPLPAQSGHQFSRYPSPRDSQSPLALEKGGSQIRQRAVIYARLPKHPFGERPTLKEKMSQSVMPVASNGKPTHRKQPKLRPRE